MLDGIIRTFLTASLAGSLVMGGLAITAIHTPAGTSPHTTLEAARAVALVTSGNAFPMLVRDAESVAQLRDIVEAMDGPTPSNPNIRQSLATIGIQAPDTDPNLLAQARNILSQARQILTWANQDHAHPGLVPAENALNRVNTLVTHKTPG